MAVKKNLTKAVIGDSLSMPLIFIDKVGAPIDVTGRTFYLTLKLNPNVEDASADAQVAVVAPAGADSANGTVTLGLPASVTETLQPTNYNYDVQMVTPISGFDDEVKTIMYGRIGFVQQITRSR